jgi:chromosome segregation ATPase
LVRQSTGCQTRGNSDKESKDNKMQETLNLMLSKLTCIETELKKVNERLDNLEEGQNSLKKDVKDLSVITGSFAERFDKVDIKLKDLDNKSEILLSDIQRVSKKLDRQSAKQDIFSATVKEHNIRLEDLEGISPVK